MDSIPRKMARFTLDLAYDQIPAASVKEAKRFLLDSVGCALAAVNNEDMAAMYRFVRRQGGAPESTLIGTGERTNASNASLMNSLLVRALDYNDIYWKQDPSHPSDIIPAALACAERQGKGGRDLILGIVLGHEFEMRLCEAAFPGIRERGWHHGTLTAFVSPIVAGRMLDLPWEKIQHAIGISASHSGTLGAVTAGKLTMMKNTVDPMATEAGVMAALLAEKGYSGPEHVIDGKEGLVDCMGPEWKLEILTDGLGDTWRIERCGMKYFPTEALTHAPISAVLQLVEENDLVPEDVAKIRIRSLARAADILADPTKYDPRNKETADHSLPYVIAAALVERKVTPAQFEPEKIMDPRIREQLHKVEVIADPEIERVFPALQRVGVTIDTTDGRQVGMELDYPKGDPRNPLTEAEIEGKFDALAEGVLSKDKARRLKDAVWKVEELDSVSELLALCVTDL